MPDQEDRISEAVEKVAEQTKSAKPSELEWLSY